MSGDPTAGRYSFPAEPVRDPVETLDALLSQADLKIAQAMDLLNQAAATLDYIRADLRQ